MLQKTFLHEGWEFAEKSWPGGKVATVDTGWLPAQVPGHVHLDLVANGVIADPFERMNELGCQWVDLKDWSYRTTFSWSPKEGCPKRVLRFEGLDTVCSVFLNGELVAEHDNMFIPLEVDVTSLLREGANELRVDFRSAVNVGLERRAVYFEKHGLKEPIERFDERAFVRKAQYMFGWDWGPRLVSCGIWRPVCLIEYAARLVDVHVEQTQRGYNVSTEVEGSGILVHVSMASGEATLGDGSLIGCLHHLYHEWLWDRDGAEINADTLVSFLLPLGTNLPDLMPRDPREGFDFAARNEKLAARAIDIRNTSIGKVHVVLVRQADEFGESFEFMVNNQEVWARGANWIPDHSFPSVIDKARLRDRLEKCKDMGFNMLRVWGGGLYETDEFYDLCDELGILVWQDFPFACSYYPDDEEWQAIIRKEAEVNIKRLRNHPCLALWCGNNENEEMFVNQWGGPGVQPPRYFGENHYNAVLPRVVAELDPGRSYIRSSPIGEPPSPLEGEGRGGALASQDASAKRTPPPSPLPQGEGEQKRRGPNADGYGDQHNWDVWHGRGDWRHYTDSKGRFSSEYGFASSCALSVWEKTLAEEDWDPHSPVVQWHDRTGKGHDTFHGFVKLHYPEPVTLEDWVYYSQLNQRDALRHGVEHYRRSEFCRGSLIWQLNDCWPVQSWAILDSDGNYKALAYELRRLYADLMLSIERQNETVRVWAVNHGSHEEDVHVTLRAVHLRTGEVLNEWTSPNTQHLTPNTILQALEANLSGLAVPDTILFAATDGRAATWQLLGEPKNSRFAPPEELVFSTSEEGVLNLRLKAPVVDLMLTDEGSPSAFYDNFITSPGGLVTVRLNYMPDTIEARSLAGEHRVRVTRGSL